MSASVLVRTLHVGAACASLGGLFYARAVLWPSLAHLPEAVRAPHLARVMRRFAYVKWSAIAVVAASGVVQWLRIYPTVGDARGYLASFAFKMAAALGLLVTTALLAMPSARLAAMQRRRGAWSALNLAFAVAILVGAALMAKARADAAPTPPDPPQARLRSQL